MAIAYFDCFSGISGDMILGVLVGALGDHHWLDDLSTRLGIDPSRIEVSTCRRGFLSASSVRVLSSNADPPQHRDQIIARINGCGLPEPVRSRSCAIVDTLIAAEAKVHGSSIQAVHLHEAGAVDALLDIAGAAYGLHLLGVKAIYASPLPLGGGTVRCAHGLIPIPAPAVLELCSGVPVHDDGRRVELVTPTGAAVLRGLDCSFGDLPRMRVQSVSYGAGQRDAPANELPNALRLIVGSSEMDVGLSINDFVSCLEANIDDATPELLAEACRNLMANGALDVFITPGTMKHGRPGWQLSIIAEPTTRQQLVNTLFLSTPTIGVRISTVERCTLPRDTVSVETRFGVVRVKVARLNGKVVNVKPEARDCFALAGQHGVTAKEVVSCAAAAAHELYRD